MPARLQDKIVIITGVTKGIASATAMRSAEEGAKVMLADTNQAELEKRAAEILNAKAYVMNVTRLGQHSGELMPLSKSMDRLIS